MIERRLQKVLKVRVRMTHEWKIEFTLTVKKISEDFWEARLTDSSGDFFSYGPKEKLALQNVFAFFSQRGFDRVKLAHKKELDDTQRLEN